MELRPSAPTVPTGRLIEIVIFVLSLAFAAGVIVAHVDSLSREIVTVQRLSTQRDAQVENQIEPIRRRMSDQTSALTRIEDLLCYRFPDACQQIMQRGGDPSQ